MALFAYDVGLSSDTNTDFNNQPLRAAVGIFPSYNFYKGSDKMSEFMHSSYNEGVLELETDTDEVNNLFKITSLAGFFRSSATKLHYLRFNEVGSFDISSLGDGTYEVGIGIAYSWEQTTKLSVEIDTTTTLYKICELVVSSGTYSVQNVVEFIAKNSDRIDTLIDLIGANDGLSTLDGDGKVPLEQMNDDVVLVDDMTQAFQDSELKKVFKDSGTVTSFTATNNTLYSIDATIDVVNITLPPITEDGLVVFYDYSMQFDTNKPIVTTHTGDVLVLAVNGVDTEDTQTQLSGESGRYYALRAIKNSSDELEWRKS